ncbi:FHIPEP family type III secretion protein [Candidatus Kuenenia stuttgartiensis]|uniref:FHIPEP family type III secretion protein n=1 Tax=Kuenenia stuttgartiensis TaxID=174633 RepID=UPI0012FF09DF
MSPKFLHLLLPRRLRSLSPRLPPPVESGNGCYGQLFSQPNAIAFAGGILTLFSIVPGLPKIPFLVLAGFFWMMFFVLRRSSKETELAEALVKETEGMAREPKEERC